MNKIFYIIFLFSNLIFSQDRTYLFYATPSGSDGWEISESHSFSEKFPITTYPLYDDYFLEKIHIYYILESEIANRPSRVLNLLPNNLLQTSKAKSEL